MEGVNFIISLEVYPFDVMVSLDQSNKDLLTLLTPYGYNKEDCNDLFEDYEDSRGRCLMLKYNQVVIRLKSQSKKYEMASLISHEVLHAVIFVMDKIGMKLKIYTSDEAYAYLTGYITKHIYKKLKL